MKIEKSDELEEFMIMTDHMQSVFDDIITISEKYLFMLKDSFVWLSENQNIFCVNFKGEKYDIPSNIYSELPCFEIAFIYSYNGGDEFYYCCLNDELQ